MKRIPVLRSTLWLMALPLAAHAQDVITLPTLHVNARRTANIRPVATYPTPVSGLEFDPRIDLQSRNMAEAQGDITIRGGIFENTGVRIGSVTIMDPQTGHYVAELPISPEMLQPPQVLTGVDNGLYGFNSTVGTVSYGWSRIESGGSLFAGAGDHALNFQGFHAAWAEPASLQEASWGAEAEASRSESDGTIGFGDHEFHRYSVRIQRATSSSQTDLFAGYQKKHFGWPELYAAPFGFHEMENLKTRLFLLSHRIGDPAAGSWEVTAYHRRHDDRYLLSREDPSIFEAVHQTDVYAVGISGAHTLDEAVTLFWAAQATSDGIESTALENSFTSRNYYKLSLLPRYRRSLANGATVMLRVGANLDATNRDRSAVSPLVDFTWQKTRSGSRSEEISLSYAGSSQVPGYTAIGGPEAGGLFRSNRALDRETTQNWELSASILQLDWSVEGAVYYRRDNGLVDWTFSEASTSARSANHLDLATIGLELIATARWGKLEAVSSYTYLGKKEDYGAEDIDASFYALNFPRHRATLGTLWRPLESVEVRIDNEARWQNPNLLRSGDDNGLYTHLAVSLRPPWMSRMVLDLGVDNLWDDHFQDVPGTPGRGDQYSVALIWIW